MRANAQIASSDARTRLLDAAERLFAEHGFHGVSMRTITAEAGVNLASGNYYFRSKDGLFRAVFERRVVVMNDERARLLQSCLERAGDQPPNISEVLDAFIGPAIRVSASPGAEMFRKLSGRVSTDPSPEVRRMVYELYDPVAMQFVDALKKACPNLGREDLFWRLACIYGAMMYVRADSGRLQRILGNDLDMNDSDAAMKHLIPFLTAGLQNPPVT